MAAPPTDLSPQLSDGGILRGDVPWLVWQGTGGPGYDGEGHWWIVGPGPKTDFAGHDTCPWGCVDGAFGPVALKDGVAFLPVGPPGSGGGFFDALADAISTYVIPAAAIVLSVAAPGVGTLVGAAILAMKQMAHGASISAALVSQAEAQIPGIASTSQFKAGFSLAEGAIGDVGNEAIEKARQAVEHVAGADDESQILSSWRQGVALGRAKTIQDAAIPKILAGIPHQDDYPGGPDNLSRVFYEAMGNGATLLDATYGITYAATMEFNKSALAPDTTHLELSTSRELVDKAVSDATFEITGVRPNPFASFTLAPKTAASVAAGKTLTAGNAPSSSSSGAKIALVALALAGVGGAAFFFYRRAHSRRANPRRRRRRRALAA